MRFEQVSEFQHKDNWQVCSHQRTLALAQYEYLLHNSSTLFSGTMLKDQQRGTTIAT